MFLRLTFAATLFLICGAGAPGLGAGGLAKAQPAEYVSQFEACPEMLDAGTPSLTCDCSAAAANAEQTIWGSRVYTDDSPICRAALHADMIGPEGGPVDVREARGRSSYPSVDSNGIRSEAWGAHPRSITFTDRGMIQ